MQDLPGLLLAYGFDLKASGNEYKSRCVSHDDDGNSMSIYRDESGDWVAHCYFCGFRDGTAGVYCELNGLDGGNEDHISQAVHALNDDSIIINTGKPFANISNEAQVQKPIREMLIPPEGSPPPSMWWLQSKDGRKFGDPAAVYIYRTESGLPLMYEARWEFENNEREFRVFSYGKRGSQTARWSCEHHIDPRPLYGLEMLASLKSRQVIVCEGPRKAFYAQQLITSIPCVGWSGGAGSWRRSDYSPLHGRQIILWPDADEEGHKAMFGLAQRLLKEGCEVFTLDDPEKADGWDSADAVNEGWDAATALEWAKSVKKKVEIEEEEQTIEEKEPDQAGIPETEHFETENFEWTEPLDIFDNHKLPQINEDMLPDAISDWCFDLSGIIGADQTLLALPAIVSAASLLHDDITIQPEINNPTWQESARLWGAMVGLPSSKKSPAMARALSIIKKIDAECNDRESRLKYEYALHEKAHSATEKAYIDKISKGEKNIPLPVKPNMPEIPRAIAQDFTIEALRDILKHTDRGILAERDELSGWFASFDQYKSGKGGSDRAAWLELYNGGSRRIERVGSGNTYVKNWSACVIGGIQPEPMREIAGNLNEDGLLQRFIVVYGRNGTQGNEQTPDGAADSRYKTMMRRVWGFTPTGDSVKLSPEANAIRKGIVAYAYKLIGLNMVSTAMTAHLGKWEGMSARLMLTYHACECADRNVNPQSIPVSVDTAQKVRRLMIDLLLPHATSFYLDVLGGSETQKHFFAVANLILANHKNEIALRDISRGWIGWHHMSESMQHAVIQRLVDSRWLHPSPEARQAKQRGLFSRYLINPTLHKFYADRVEKEKNRRAEVVEIIKEIRSK